MRSLPFNSRRLEDYLESHSGASEQTRFRPAGFLHVSGERSKGSYWDTQVPHRTSVATKFGLEKVPLDLHELGSTCLKRLQLCKLSPD